jgi:hypothetical protein
MQALQGSGGKEQEKDDKQCFFLRQIVQMLTLLG